MTTDDLQQFEIDQGWKHLKTMWRVKHGETIHHLKGMPVLSLCSWMYAMVSMLVQQNADTHPARPCLMAGAASLFKVFPRALSFHVSQHRIQTLSTIVSFGNMANAAASYCWGRLLECLQIYQCCTKRSKRGIQLDMLAGRSSRVYHVQERQIVPGHRFTYTLSAFASSSSTCSLIKVIGWKLASLLDISPVGYENIKLWAERSICTHRPDGLSRSLECLPELSSCSEAVKQWNFMGARSRGWRVLCPFCVFFWNSRTDCIDNWCHHSHFGMM
jgi:hypothetical protein